MAPTMVHYLFGFIYGRKNLAIVFESPKRKAFFFLASIFSIVCALWAWPAMGWLFAIHMALTDVYVFRDTGQKTFRLIAYSLFYMRLMYSSLIDQYYSAVFYIDVLLILAFIFIALRNKKYSKDLRTFDFIPIVALILLQINGEFFVLKHMVFYHVAFWFFLPIFEKPKEDARKYLWQSTALIALFLLIDRIIYVEGFTPRFASFDPTAWISIFATNDWVLFLAYIHIFLTPFMSRANPDFVNRWLGFKTENK